MASVPHDRTTKQPVTCYCRNPECCAEGRDMYHWQTEQGDVVCPKCGANRAPFVGVMALVHLLVRDPSGPVFGAGGLRYRIACEPTRRHTATATNQEAVTSEVMACTCEPCLSIAVEQKLAKSQGMDARLLPD